MLSPLAYRTAPRQFQISRFSAGFLALDVELGATDREPTELMEVVLLDPEEAFTRARDGRINEGQSALALLMAEPLVRERLARD